MPVHRPPAVGRPPGMNSTTRRVIATMIAVGFLLTACAPGGGAGASPATDPPGTPTAPDAEPDFAWALDGNGAPSAGGMDLQFDGAHDFWDHAVALDGYTGFGTSAGPGPVDTTQSFSVAAWVNLGSRAGIAAAVSQLAAVTAPFHLGVGDSKWWFMMKTEDRTGLDFSVSAQGPTASPSASWTHLVGVHDRDAGVIRLYLDGKLASEAAFTSPVKADGPLVIGRAQFDSSPGNFWPGAVGDVAIYQVNLGAEQIAAIFASTRPTTGPPPLPAPDPSSYADGLLNGTWDMVTDGALKEFILRDFGVSADEVRARWGFDGHKWWLGFLFDGELFLEGGVPEGAGGTLSIEGDVLTTDEGWTTIDWLWTLEGDVLTVTVIGSCLYEGSGPACSTDPAEADIKPFPTVQVWTKSGDDPSW